MTSYPKGYYIFINNMKFRMGEERTGAEQDQKFQEVLEDMGFKGEYHTNKTTQVFLILYSIPPLHLY